MCKVFPDLLLATMDILYNQYKQLKGKDGGAVNNEYKERVSFFCELNLQHSIVTVLCSSSN